MGLTNPNVGDSKPFSDVIPDGAFFILKGVKVAEGIPTAYGDGDMVVMDVIYNGEEHRVSVWGRYLVEQARAVEPSDLNKRYRMIRGLVEGYSKREVKHLVPEGADDIPF